MNAQLKVWLRKRVLLLIKKLRKVEKKIIGITDAEPNYSSLSPLGNSADNKHYSDALDWALKNRAIKDIKNIALTGPYGSGKSTILKTYYQNHGHKDLKFLFISLATFKEEHPNSAGIPIATEAEAPLTGEKNQLLRLIETSILQQIFYHENDDKIPDSRFKKIRSFSLWQLIGYSVIYSLFLMSLYSYLKPGFIQGIFKELEISKEMLSFLHYGTIAVIALGLFGIIFSSIRVIRSVSLQKLNFQNAEIGVGINQNKSILNHHIDEILYFFSVRPYNVVVIEDLDRFKQTEIFTKLREINLLLNNSKKTKQKDIVFIYAVRDELFTDDERTKFFDFIIPVIPIINSSNSAKVLMAKRQEYAYHLSDSLIEDLAYYIDDMRLLHNITNEFYLYKEMLDTNLSQDKLFAIITYKNKHPQQFVALSKNSGVIYDMIYSKRTEIEASSLRLNDKISDLKQQINRLGELFTTNLEDLRRLYLLQLILKLNNFKDFVFDGEIISVQDMTEEQNFAHWQNNRLQYQYKFPVYNRDDIATKAVEIALEVIEKLVDPERTYQERVDEIDDLNSDRIIALRSKIQELEKEKESLRNLPIAKIMQQKVINAEPGQEIKLEEILIRNGYISEDYLDYISLFHDGDISRTDYQFLLNLKNNRALDMDYRLQKPGRVLSKINLLTFQTYLVLNFDLFELMLNDQESYYEHLKRVIEVLKDESDISVKFITEYLDRTTHLGPFLRTLSLAWPNIWNFYQHLAETEESKKQEIFTWLVTYLENAEIAILSKHYDLTKKISIDPLFPQILTDQSKLCDLLDTLSIKFQQLDMAGTAPDTLQYIFKNDHYELSPVMVTAMLKHFGKYDQHAFENSNYKAIKDSKSPELIAYVDKNINIYIEFVYLRLEKNTADEEATLLLLLNNASLKTELKYKIVGKMAKTITVLAKVKDKEVIAELFKQHKVLPTWDNLLHDFLNHEKEMSEEVIAYLNASDNAKTVSGKKVPSDGERRADYSAFSRKLMMVTTFNDEVLKTLASSLSVWFSDLDLSAHSYTQVEVLVNSLVICPTEKSFDYLKEEFNPLHVNFFGTPASTIMKILPELTLDSADMESILASNKIMLAIKSQILEQVEESLVASSAESLKTLTGLLDVNPNFNVSATLLDAALMSLNTNSVERIRVLMSRKNADADFLTSFISTLDGNYLKINDKSKRPSFTKGDLNQKFLQLLQDRKLISTFPEHKGLYKVYHRTN